MLRYSKSSGLNKYLVMITQWMRVAPKNPLKEISLLLENFWPGGGKGVIITIIIFDGGERWTTMTQYSSWWSYIWSFACLPLQHEDDDDKENDSACTVKRHIDILVKRNIAHTSTQKRRPRTTLNTSLKEQTIDVELLLGYRPTDRQMNTNHPQSTSLSTP